MNNDVKYWEMGTIGVRLWNLIKSLNTIKTGCSYIQLFSLFTIVDLTLKFKIVCNSHLYPITVDDFNGCVFRLFKQVFLNVAINHTAMACAPIYCQFEFNVIQCSAISRSFSTLYLLRAVMDSSSSCVKLIATMLSCRLNIQSVLKPLNVSVFMGPGDLR